MVCYLPHFISATSIPTSNNRLMLALERLSAVDNLSKYNIICHIYRYPNVYGDAAYFAQTLGFHSVEQTQAALDALCAAGILSCTGVRYGRAADAAIWEAISNVCSLGSHSPEYRILVQRLAQRSARNAR